MKYRFSLFLLGVLLFAGCSVRPTANGHAPSVEDCITMINDVDSYTPWIEIPHQGYTLQGSVSFFDLFIKVRAFETGKGLIRSDVNGRILLSDDGWQIPANASFGTLPQLPSLSSLIKRPPVGMRFLSAKRSGHYTLPLAITILLWPWDNASEQVTALKRNAFVSIEEPFLVPTNDPPSEPLCAIIGALLVDSFGDDLSYDGKEEVRRIIEDGLSDDDKAILQKIVQAPDWNVRVILSLFDIAPPPNPGEVRAGIRNQ